MAARLKRLTVLWQGHAEHRLLLVFQVGHHLSEKAQPLVDFFHLQTEQEEATGPNYSVQKADVLLNIDNNTK